MMKISNDNWLEVPANVQRLFDKYAAAVDDLVETPPNVRAGWIFDTEEVGPIFISKHAFDIRGAIAGIPHLFSQGVDNAQKLVGGPNPLTAGLVGGAMGAGLGYGGGWLAHKVAPKYVDEDAARKWSMLGGAAGGGIPLLLHGYPNIKELGWRGLFQPSRFQGRQGGEAGLRGLLPDKQDWTPEERTQVAQHALQPAAEQELLAHRWTPDEEDELTRAHVYDALHKTGYDIAGTLKVASDMFGIVPVDDLFLEKAADGIAGAWLGDIPIDEWGRTIMYDPYLDDHSKAIAAGLPAAAAAATGSRWVSPVDVARVAANTALGRVTGWGIGQLAKTFLGITPYAREQLQNAGTLAGAVRGVLGML
jgi:hypothetical protein